jgi:hypothetical protein
VGAVPLAGAACLLRAVFDEDAAYAYLTLGWDSADLRRIEVGGRGRSRRSARATRRRPSWT